MVAFSRTPREDLREILAWRISIRPALSPEMSSSRTIAVIGLGYVGLPVAAAFGRAGFKVIGFDINTERIGELRKNFDRTREVSAEDIGASGVTFTSTAGDLRQADFHIVTVPTPIDTAHAPDLAMLLGASRTVGGALKRGDIVVYEFDRLSRRNGRRLRPGAGTGLRT